MEEGLLKVAVLKAICATSKVCVVLPVYAPEGDSGVANSSQIPGGRKQFVAIRKAVDL